MQPSYKYTRGDQKAAIAKMNVDPASKLTASISFNKNAKGDDQNAIARSLRDSGITISKPELFMQP